MNYSCFQNSSSPGIVSVQSSLGMSPSPLGTHKDHHVQLQQHKTSSSSPVCVLMAKPFYLWNRKVSPMLPLGPCPYWLSKPSVKVAMRSTGWSKPVLLTINNFLSRKSRTSGMLLQQCLVNWTPGIVSIICDLALFN